VENDGANGLPPVSLIKSVFYPDNGGAPLAAGPYSYTLYKDSAKSAVYSSGSFEVKADDGTNPDINTFNFCELLLRVYPVTGYADDFLSCAAALNDKRRNLPKYYQFPQKNTCISFFAVLKYPREAGKTGRSGREVIGPTARRK
jgi:hypothetical protein